MSSQLKKPARKWQQQPVANHASEARELSAGGDRTANAQKAETEANGVRAVESGQDRMAIRARVVGSAPVPMEIAVHAVARNVVNGAADPVSAAHHSIVRSSSSALTRTATAS